MFRSCQPIKIVQHESRPKTNGAPFLEVAVDFFRVRGKILASAVKFAVVPQIMHPDLEAVSRQLVAQFLRVPDTRLRE